MRPLSKKLLWAAKLGFGISLLWVLLGRVDPAGLGERLRSADARWLVLMFAVPHLGILISAWKWQLLLRARSASVPLGRLFALYMIGTFFNSFLPSMMGGDVVRIYALGRERQQVAVAAAATFMERFTGLVALVTLMPLALLQTDVVETAPVIGWVILAAVGACALTLWLVFSSFVPRLPPGRVKTLAALLGFLDQTRDHIRSFRRTPWTLLACYGISVLFYLMAAVTVWLAAQSVHTAVPFGPLVAVQPSILFVGMVPVSVNGLGILEAGYVVFLGFIGVSGTAALSIALLIRARILLTAILGGVTFLVYRRRVDDSAANGSAVRV